MLAELVATQVGAERAAVLVRGLVLHPALLEPADDASRAVIAQALTVVLLDDLVGRVPGAAAFAEASWAAGRGLHLDHAAVRTVAGVACGELAEGGESVARLLRPLGYTRPGTHHEWHHVDLPRAIPRFLVGEVHADRFPEPATAAVARVVGTSHDPLTGLAEVHLDRLAADGRLPRNAAESLLGELAGCFARHHGTPTLADYEILLAESDEMAWIATEGTTWHHAAFLVDQSEARPAGAPAMVERPFKVGERATVTRTVPGSSFELISRGRASG